MTTETPFWSSDFRRLYCDATAFDSFSALHPISFKRVLPFQSPDEAVDDRNLIAAEEAHLAERSDATRRGVVEEYVRCGLLQESEATDLKSVIDYFAADFFELMGLVYANAGMFRCALRWHRELIKELDTQNPNLRSDEEDAYASVGYCLYSLGLFEEAIAWSKSCIGPRALANVVCEALIAYEVQPVGGEIQAVERSGPRTRYTVSAIDASDAAQSVARLKEAMKVFAPFEDVYFDWIACGSPGPGVQAEGYPFKAEYDASCLLRHKMNLIFATCWQADALAERGYIPEAKRLLAEATMLEPNASFVSERLRVLDHQPST